MKSLKIKAFCLLKELEEMVLPICNEYGLQLLSFSGAKYEINNLEDPLSCKFSKEMKRLFLFSSIKGDPANFTFNSITPKESGWIDIVPGGLVKKGANECVLMSVISVSNLDDGESTTWKAVGHLKRSVKKAWKAGVIGENILNDGNAVYKDIWYGPGAQKVLDKGASWKQGVDFNVYFQPK